MTQKSWGPTTQPTTPTHPTKPKPTNLWSIYKKYLNHPLGLTLSTPGLVSPIFPYFFNFIFSSSHVLPAWGFQHTQMWNIFSHLIKTTILFQTAASELVRQTLQIIAKHTLSCFQSIHHLCLSKFIVWSQMRHILLMEAPDFYIMTVIN